MRVYNTANIRKFPVEDAMCLRVRGRVKVPFNTITIEIDNNHIRCLHLIVLYTRWLDDKEPLFAVNARHIPPCERHEMVFRKEHIRLVDLFLKLFQHSIPSLVFGQFIARDLIDLTIRCDENIFAAINIVQDIRRTAAVIKFLRNIAFTVLIGKG